MSFSIAKSRGELLFVPLGGAGEIGVNAYLYHYDGKWLMVDLGIGFADETIPGVQITVPNINYVLEKIVPQGNLVGLVITHAHEDHIGAVPYFWNDLNCKVYTSKFAAAILTAKFKDFGIKAGNQLVEVPEKGRLDIGPFNIEFVHATHSIPEMNGLVIRTEGGKIFHTGDWKFDPNPQVGEVTDTRRLEQIGDEGILAMVGDSTNIFSPGTSGSEGALKSSLIDIISGYQSGMVVVTTFASNVARVHTLAQVAQKCGRKVVLAGRSLWRMYDAAKASGYLGDLAPFIMDKDFGKYPRNEIMLICTGCQGEEMAAMTKIANNDHPQIKLAKGDKVLFSSKIIPGNDKKLFALFNKLCKRGVEVLTERDHFIHVSGHPCRDEMSQMYDLIRPKVAIPVHGEAMHIHEHAKFAQAKGAKAIEVENGNVVRITEEGAEIVSQVEHGLMAVDGNFLIESDTQIIRMRRDMKNNGLIAASVVLDKKGQLVGEVQISAPGILDNIEDRDLIDSMADLSTTLLAKKKGLTQGDIEKIIAPALRKTLKAEIGKNSPFILQLHNI
jgi:ribonuclease J